MFSLLGVILENFLNVGWLPPPPPAAYAYQYPKDVCASKSSPVLKLTVPRVLDESEWIELRHIAESLQNFYDFSLFYEHWENE